MIYNIKKIKELKGKYNYLERDTREDQIEHLRELLEKGIEFNPHVNILIGENGCGKSTIINMLRDVNFVEKSFIPKIGSFPNIKIAETFETADCVEIKADYSKPVFNLYRMIEDWKTMSDSNDAMEDKWGVAQRFAAIEESKGQNQIGDFRQLINIAYGGSYEGAFHIIYNNKDKHEDNIKLYKWYESNHKEGDNYTFLMDEPDAGLDIKNLKAIYDFIEYMATKRDDTQVVVSLHNVALITKLRKIEGINWIDVSGKDYLKEIEEFCK
ncbi:MAG: AAA family ATPase [Clostridia bacterium]|nr:AAA family ATPase [Clostridia bacterium]